MSLSRRGFITGLAATFAAPAIVRASSLMPVKAMPAEDNLAVMQKLLEARLSDAYRVTKKHMDQMLYGDTFSRTFTLGDESKIEHVPAFRVYRNAESVLSVQIGEWRSR